MTLREPPSNERLAFLRKVGIGASLGTFLSLLSAATIGIFADDLPVEFAFIFLALALLCNFILGWARNAVQVLVQDPVRKARVKSYYRFCGGMGAVAIVLALTDPADERGANPRPPSPSNPSRLYRAPDLLRFFGKISKPEGK